MSDAGSRRVIAVEPTRRGLLGRTVKRLAQGVAGVLVLPRLFIHAINRSVCGRDRALAAASESIARIPGARGVYLRQAFYRYTLDKCGRDVYFGWQTVFSKPAARIGDRVYFGHGCGIGWADIGAGAMLADGVQILSGSRQHGLSSSVQSNHQDQPQVYRRVTIGAGVWLGTNAIVMADVGARTVVGAGAVVTQALPADVVAVGVPARIVGPVATRSLDR